MAIREREIDQIVYKLYRLTGDEIKLVDAPPTKDDLSGKRQAEHVASTRSRALTVRYTQH